MSNTYKVGQQVKYNQGRGKGLIGKILRVDEDAKALIIKAQDHDLAFRRSFDKVQTFRAP